MSPAALRILIGLLILVFALGNLALPTLACMNHDLFLLAIVFVPALQIVQAAAITVWVGYGRQPLVCESRRRCY